MSAAAVDDPSDYPRVRPEVYRGLSHLAPPDRTKILTSTFTDELRREIRRRTPGDDVVSRVFQFLEMRVTQEWAGLLSLAEGDAVVRRAVTLRAASDDRVLAAAWALLVVDRLNVGEREAILEATLYRPQRPLGDVLDVGSLPRFVTSWGRVPHAPVGHQFLHAEYPWLRSFLTRQSVVERDGKPLALVAEYWPERDPHA